MARNFLMLTVLLGVSALGAFAQSGRVKTKETPTPTPAPRPRVVYTPTENLASPQPTPLPPPPPVNSEDDDEITIESALVPIPVSVTDREGAAVRNLRLEDFILTIDGKVVEIGDLARSETPVRLALLFDNSSSVLIAREFEKKAAIKFFKKVIRPDKDLAALFSVATYTRLEQPFTRDMSQLTAAIQRFPAPEGATSLLDGVIKAAEYLKEVNGRRVIVIMSDGVDTISDATFEQALRAAHVNNCQIYVVKTTDFENYKRTGQRGGNANIRSLEAERRMQEFAAQTGGAVYSPLDERELDLAFTQISAELSEQYILSYYPENDRDSRGRFRTISLSLKNRDDVIVRTRKGYYVPRR
jgi:Ca-activated chloride channel family protein